MENIDDFMRQKFDSDDPGARFEFREEYWEQAQALLEKEEDRRRRWWWILACLALAMALVALFLFGPWGSGTVSQNTGTTGDDLYGNAPRREESIQRAVPESPALGDTTTSLNRINKENLDRVSTQTIGKDRISATKATNENAFHQRQLGEKGVSNVDQKVNNRGEFNRNGKNKAVAALPDKDRASLTPSLPNPTGKNDTTTGDVSNNLNNSAGSTALDTNAQVSTPAFELPVQTPQTLQTAQTTTPQPSSLPIYCIPTPLTPFPLPERIPAPIKPSDKGNESIAEHATRPVHDNRFSIGFSVSGTAYQPSDTSGRWAGWCLGAYGEYRLDQNWAFMLGVQGRFVPGFQAETDSAHPVNVEQLRYSFGFHRESWKRETCGFYALEIPLSAHWHKGPWGLEAGGAAGMLLLVQDRTEHTVSSSLEGAKTEVKRWIKGDRENYNPNYFSTFAGAEYRLNNRLSVTAKGQYRFKPVFKTVSEGTQNKGLGNVELGLRVRLF